MLGLIASADSSSIGKKPLRVAMPFFVWPALSLPIALSLQTRSKEQTEASVRCILPDLFLANVATATSSSPHLKRQLGLWSATALVVGEVIAVGIFLTPAQMSKSIGSPLWIAVVWLVVGAMSLCGALCYGELAARYPEAGGGCVCLRAAYG